MKKLLNKIAQELNNDLNKRLNDLYAKVYELTNNLESSEVNRELKGFGEAIKIISAWENKFGIEIKNVKPNDKKTLANSINALKNFYLAVTNAAKQNKIKIDNKYDRDLLMFIYNEYMGLSKL